MAKTANMVVVITDQTDPHLPFVQRHLAQPLVVIDPKELLRGKALSYACDKSGQTVLWDGLDLSSVSGIWYRKPGQIVADDLPVPPAYRIYSQTALQQHLALLYSALPHATWVSDYYAITRANDKFLQLAVARHVGFNTLPTLVTSDRTAAQAFIAAQPACVVKPLTTAFPKQGTTTQVFYTTRLHKEQLPDLSGLHLAPAIFQRAVAIDHEVRAVVVGTQVFAARIDAARRSNTPGVYDNGFSSEQGTVTITAYKRFPKAVAERCVAHAQALGLTFSAIDLAVDRSGAFWFLENNPNGQWAYIEAATGQPIGAALAHLLQG